MEPSLINTEITEEVLRFVLYGKKTEFPENLLNAPAQNQRKVPAFLPVPRQVLISQSSLPGGQLGVFSTTGIRQGTEMGPFVGRIVGPQNINRFQHNCNYWEQVADIDSQKDMVALSGHLIPLLYSDGVCKSGEEGVCHSAIYDNTGYIIYYIDGGTEDRPASWLTYVQCARSEEEQNLEVIQIGHEIYYKATKDIGPEQELLVWYSTCSSLHMGLPFSILHDQLRVSSKFKDDIIQQPQENSATISVNSGKLKCVLCRRGFNSRSNLRSHMRIHTMEKPFPCRYCNRRFSQSSTLRNHVRLHTGEKPYKCQVCRSSYSQLAGLRAHQRSAKHKPNVQTK